MHKRANGAKRIPVAPGTEDPGAVHAAAERARGDDHRLVGRRDLRPLFRSRHDRLLRRRAAERGGAGGDPGGPRRAGARVAPGRARRRQHRRGVRARRRAGADRARDDRGVGKRHRRGAGAVERRYAAAQGDVGNARMRRRPRRRRTSTRWKARIRAYPEGLARAMVENAAADLSGLVRAGRARRARRDAVALSDPHRDRLQRSSASSPD